MTIAAYQTLYQSSVTFAMRKQLQAEHGKSELEKTLDVLEGKRTQLQNKVKELISKLDAIDKRDKERTEVEAKNNEKEMEFLSNQQKQLAGFLQQLKAE